MPKNDTIFKRLEQATKAERLEICNILDLNEEFIDNLDKISAEFRSVSGNTIANTFRNANELEYKVILQDTYMGLSSNIKKDKNFNALDASEEWLEKRVEFIMESIYKDLKIKYCETSSDEFRKKLISEGKFLSGIETVIGGGGIGLLTKLLTLPVAIGATAGQAMTTPTYRKTFQVVAKIIQIKKRVRVETKLKDLFQ